MWLDPMPVAEDLGKAYINYYTHSEPRRNGKTSRLRKLCRSAHSLYLRKKYGYSRGTTNGIAYRLGSILHLHIAEAGSTFLESVPGGKLLDVGCGAGGYLGSMRELGWEVTGVDFDSAAVEAARLAGFDVNCGSLEGQLYPTASFDAVTLNHVIEHLPDPVATLRECARILKPEGKLMLFTPNSASLGHRLFKRDWRGLEPPRHLFLYSPGSISSLLHQTGFAGLTTRPQIGSSLIYESCLLRRGVKGPFASGRQYRCARFFARSFAMLEMILQLWQPRVTDCLGVVATKRSAV